MLWGGHVLLHHKNASNMGHRKSGVGIGWSISKDDIVMGHKGTLEVASRGP